MSLSVSGLEGKFHREDTLPSLMHPQGGRPQIMLSTALTKYCYHYCYQCYYSDRFFLSEDALIGVLAPHFWIFNSCAPGTCGVGQVAVPCDWPA